MGIPDVDYWRLKYIVQIPAVHGILLPINSRYVVGIATNMN